MNLANHTSVGLDAEKETFDMWFFATSVSLPYHAEGLFPLQQSYANKILQSPKNNATKCSYDMLTI